MHDAIVFSVAIIPKLGCQEIEPIGYYDAILYLDRVIDHLAE